MRKLLFVLLANLFISFAPAIEPCENIKERINGSMRIFTDAVKANPELLALVRENYDQPGLIRNKAQPFIYDLLDEELLKQMGIKHKFEHKDILSLFNYPKAPWADPTEFATFLDMPVEQANELLQGRTLAGIGNQVRLNHVAETIGHPLSLDEVPDDLFELWYKLAGEYENITGIRGAGTGMENKKNIIEDITSWLKHPGLNPFSQEMD